MASDNPMVGRISYLSLNIMPHDWQATLEQYPFHSISNFLSMASPLPIEGLSSDEGLMLVPPPLIGQSPACTEEIREIVKICTLRPIVECQAYDPRAETSHPNTNADGIQEF